MITHKFTVHGKCPINGLWDYYELEIRTEDFVDVADLEDACNAVRGSNQTQESMARELRELIPDSCTIILRGSHSQNSTTEIEL